MQIVPTQSTQSNNIITPVPYQDRHDDWLMYFDPLAALGSVSAHVAGLGSTRLTPEKHTAHLYERHLKRFFAFLSGYPYEIDRPLQAYLNHALMFPDEVVLRAYVGKQSQRGLKAVTIQNYLAPVFHWVRALSRQRPQCTPTERNAVEDYRIRLLNALDITIPRDDPSSLPAAYRHGTRLTVTQMMDMLTLISTDSRELTRKRDLALIWTGLATALRVAELGRITLNSIEQIKDGYIVTVRGKRNNNDPVGINDLAVDLICDWVESWNKDLAEDDPRYIGRDTPVWQPLRVGGTRWEMSEDYNPANGLSRQTIHRILKKRSTQTIGIDLSPHDLRRTTATLLHEEGVPYSVIQWQLRHASAITTEKYIGVKPEYNKTDLSKFFDMSWLKPA